MAEGQSRVMQSGGDFENLFATSDPVRVSELRVNEQIIAVIEAERGKIAREMHDEAGQLLISAALRLDQAMAMLPVALPARELLDQARQALDDCSESLHRMAFNLRPRILDDLGLVPALKSYLRRHAELDAIDVDIDLEEPPSKLDHETDLAVFRIVQEAVANIRKHAQATAVHVHLSFTERHLELEVSDNGVGFDPDGSPRERDGRPRLGLAGMRERAAAVGGHLKIVSGRLLGTTVRVMLPIRNKSN